MPSGLESDHGSPKWYCTICDQGVVMGQRWFALAQNRLQDRLSIFHPEEDTGLGRVHYACSPAHVRELVIHWMVTGNLDYPFAQPVPRRRPAAHGRVPLWDPSHQRLLTPIGELAVDRDAVQRLLGENPAGLEVILAELNDALEKSVDKSPETGTLADLPESLLPRI